MEPPMDNPLAHLIKSAFLFLFLQISGARTVMALYHIYRTAMQQALLVFSAPAVLHPLEMIIPHFQFVVHAQMLHQITLEAFAIPCYATVVSALLAEQAIQTMSQILLTTLKQVGAMKDLLIILLDAW
jgi:hypothetical protein